MDNRRYNNDRSDYSQSGLRNEQNRSSSFDSDYDSRDQNRRQNFSSDYYDRSRSYEGAQDLNNRYERNNVDRNFNQQRSDYDRNRSYTSSSSSYPSYPSSGQSNSSYGANNYGSYGSNSGSTYGSNAGNNYGSSSSFGSSYDRNAPDYSNYSNQYQNHDRSMMDRAESGWENIKESAKNFFGKGPKGYKRSDERIKEEISDALYRHPRIDASEIEIDVKDGMVTLRGTVEDRQTKRMAEDLAEDCSGVSNVSNQLMVNSSFGSQNPTTSATQSQTATTGTSSTGRSKSIQ